MSRLNNRVSLEKAKEWERSERMGKLNRKRTKEKTLVGKCVDDRRRIIIALQN